MEKCSMILRIRVEVEWIKGQKCVLIRSWEEWPSPIIMCSSIIMQEFSFLHFTEIVVCQLVRGGYFSV